MGIPSLAMVAFDIATLPWSRDGFRYVLIMVDLFSKYIEAVPMKDQTAQSVTGASIGVGVPISSTFRSRPKRRRLSCETYHPQGDGEAERGIQSFKAQANAALA